MIACRHLATHTAGKWKPTVRAALGLLLILLLIPLSGAQDQAVLTVAAYAPPYPDLPQLAASRSDLQVARPTSAAALERVYRDVPGRTDAKPTPGERWERFETEFGIAQLPPSSAFKQTLRVAKYQVDTVLFTFDRLISDADDAFEWECKRGRWRRTGSVEDDILTRNMSSSRHWLDDARLKVDFHLTGTKPYLGLRLVLPFGD